MSGYHGMKDMRGIRGMRGMRGIRGMRRFRDIRVSEVQEVSGVSGYEGYKWGIKVSATDLVSTDAQLKSQDIDQPTRWYEGNKGYERYQGTRHVRV